MHCPQGCKARLDWLRQALVSLSRTFTSLLWHEDDLARLVCLGIAIGSSTIVEDQRGISHLMLVIAIDRRGHQERVVLLSPHDRWQE